MEGRSQRIRAGLGELAAGTVALPGALPDARARFLERRGPGHLLVLAIAFAAMVAAGLVAERLGC
jgi:hypothetical protein